MSTELKKEKKLNQNESNIKQSYTKNQKKNSQKKNDMTGLNLVTCSCGYNNRLFNVQTYGTCTRCGKILDEKVKFKYEMFCKLNLWRKKKGR